MPNKWLRMPTISAFLSQANRPEGLLNFDQATGNVWTVQALQLRTNLPQVHTKV